MKVSERVCHTSTIFFCNHLSLIKDLDKEKNAMISHVLKLGSLGQRLSKNHFVVYLRISRYLKSFTLFITVKAIPKLNLGHIDKFEIKI